MREELKHRMLKHLNFLTLEGINLPDNYKEMVLLISSVKGFGFDKAELLSQWVKFRNIISHEYLDSIGIFILCKRVCGRVWR